MYKVYARTQITDWVFIDEFETKEQARKKVSEILDNDAGVTCTIEEDHANP